jgi:hypothetical protein
MRPFELLDCAGALGPQIWIAHDTLIAPLELALIRNTNTAVSYSPVARQWKCNAVASDGVARALQRRVAHVAQNAIASAPIQRLHLPPTQRRALLACSSESIR